MANLNVATNVILQLQNDLNGQILAENIKETDLTGRDYVLFAMRISMRIGGIDGNQ